MKKTFKFNPEKFKESIRRAKGEEILQLEKGIKEIDETLKTWKRK